MKKIRKALALLLSVMMLIQAAPLQAFAEDDLVSDAVSEVQNEGMIIEPEGTLEPEDSSETDNAEESEEAAEAVDVPEENDVQVLYEVEEQRGIAEKHFKLSDGSFVAAAYPGPVHYETEDGDFEDIDNTLTLSKAYVYSSGEVKQANLFQAQNGKESKSFSSILRPDEKFLSLSNGDYSLGMAILHPDTAQELTAGKTLEFKKEKQEEDVSASSMQEQDPNTSTDPEVDPETEDKEELPQPLEAEIPGPVQELGNEASINSGLTEESGAAGTEENSPESEPESAVPSEPDQPDGEASDASQSTAPTDDLESSAVENAEPENDGQGEEGTDKLPSANIEKTDPSTAEMAVSVSAKVDNPESARTASNIFTSIKEDQANTAEAEKDSMSKRSLEEQLQPEKISSTVTYENVWPGVDLRYYNYGYHVKESIVVKQPQKSYRYSFLFHFDGLTPVLRENGAVDLINEDGEIIYQIPAPYMVDADQAISYDAAYELAETKEGYVLTVSASEEWINDENRAFPVMIDPTLILMGGSYQGNITMTGLSSGRTTTGAELQSLYLGRDKVGNITQGFAQFGTLPALPTNCNMVKATFNLYQYSYIPVGMTSLALRAHEVTVSRPSNYATNDAWIKGMTWQTKPYFDPNLSVTYAKSSASTNNAYLSWDISQIVSKWYTNGTANRILAFDAVGPSEFSATNCANSVFWLNANSLPAFLIFYRNTVGLEPRYTYQTMDIGRAGVANIGDYSSQLVLANTLFTFPSDVSPFSLTAYYNSSQGARNFSVNNSAGLHTANYSTMNIGAGWKLSVQETVIKTTVQTNSASTSYYVYTDEDGTEHYFDSSSSQSSFSDEDGLGLTLTISGSTYTLKDEKGNKKDFYNGYLIQETDRNGNILYYIYNNSTAYSSSSPFNPSSSTWRPKSGQSNQLTQIVQVNDNGSAADVQKRLCKFTYESGYLAYVTDMSGKKYAFTQITSPSGGDKVLACIDFPDNYSAWYAYNSSNKLLEKAFDEEAKYGMNFGYQVFFGNRMVQSVKEYTANTLSGAQTVGNAWHSWNNSLQQKMYRFYGQDHIKDTEDDIVSYYLFDLAGRTINTINRNSDRSRVLGASAAAYTKNQGTSKSNNRVSGVATSGIHGINLIQNSGFEIDPDYILRWDVPRSSSGMVLDGMSCKIGLAEANPGTFSKTGYYYLCVETYENDTTRRRVPQSIYLTAGKEYVLSAYVNTTKVTRFDAGGGVSLSFDTIDGTILAQSDIVNYSTSEDVADGWTRLSVSFQPTVSGNYYISGNVEKAYSCVGFDDFQLEEVPTVSESMPSEKRGSASSANLLQMGGLEAWYNGDASADLISTFWEYDPSRVVPQKQSGADAFRGLAFYSTSSPYAKRRASQKVRIGKNSDITFMLSGWAKASPVPNCASPQEMSGDNSGGKPFFGLMAELNYYGISTPEYHYVAFDPEYSDWQYASGFIAPKKADERVDSIKVSVVYDYNINIALFDQISLTEEPAQTYKYDSNGKLISVTASKQSSETYTYSGPDLTKMVSPSSGTFTYAYDSSHNMTKATNDGINLTAQYDAAGNNTLAKLQKGASGTYVQSSATYTDDKNHASSITDANGITSNYTYLASGRLSTSKTPYAGGTVAVTHQYVSGTNDRPSNTYISGTVNLTNSYDKGSLSSVVRKTFRGSTVDWLKYTTPTDNWGNITNVKVQSGTHEATEADVIFNYPITLASYTYGANNGPMTSMKYGNGDKEEYEYDLYGRLISTQYTTDNVLDRVESSSYDSNGNIAHTVVTDGSNQVVGEYRYEYDSLGRLIRSSQNGSGVTRMRTNHQYDSQNRLFKQIWELPSRTLWETYTYNNANGTLSSIDSPVSILTYGYDDLRRLQSETIQGVYQKRRNYTNGTISSSHQTLQPNYLNYYKADGETLKFGYRYLYGADGNIKEIKSRTGTAALATEYTFEYDKLGQLVKSVGPNGTETYTYDTAGNLLSRKLGSTTTSYTYGNGNWGDLLLEYKGQQIAYEGQTYNSSSNSLGGMIVSGNPISYYNGTRWTMEWESGRRLKKATANGKTVTYTYDTSGLRTSKTYNGTKYSYAYAGDKLIWQGWGNEELYFFYNASGEPLEFWHYTNGTKTKAGFYYTNLQGDVVRIEDVSGNVLASYSYDPWGKLRSYSGTYATKNPLRYRGYYYDTETGFYYLQSRYYDPTVSRFINADSYASTGQGFLGYNMFVYCGNNPVNRADASGSRYVRMDNLGGGGSPSANGAGSKYVVQSQKKYIDPQSPPPPESGYKPPKKGLSNNDKGRVKNPNGPGKGWPAKDGGVWVPDNTMDGDPGWVVQYPDGHHWHAYPEGGTREHISPYAGIGSDWEFSIDQQLIPDAETMGIGVSIAYFLSLMLLVLA